MERNLNSILDKFNLKGRTAVVTGGAGLLGRGFSRTLTQAGAAVLVADENIAESEKVVTEISPEGRAEAFELDVTRPESVKAMAHKAKDTFGSLDILVCSAALDPKFDPHPGDKYEETFEDYPLEKWQRALDVNLTGVFLSAQAAAPLMLAQGGGVMITIASIYGSVAPDQRIYQNVNGACQYKPAYYSASKAGVLGLTRYLAAYYAGKDIRVNALSPGGVFNDHCDDFVRDYSARTILGRMADKDELNAALLFLASDASSYMTGANLSVDGGWTAW
jgi:NAD(P)-dependent dehydrogenase (short-subunit alcohol dehydrogenase family)